jgi:hypothetical protein
LLFDKGHQCDRRFLSSTAGSKKNQGDQQQKEDQIMFHGGLSFHYILYMNIVSMNNDYQHLLDNTLPGFRLIPKNLLIPGRLFCIIKAKKYFSSVRFQGGKNG